MNTNHFTIYANDLKIAYNYTKDYPEKYVYGDYLTVGMLDYYFQYDNKFLKLIDSVNSTDDIKDSFVILDGSRSCEITSTYIEGLKPEFIKNIPKIKTGTAKIALKITLNFNFLNSSFCFLLSKLIA